MSRGVERSLQKNLRVFATTAQQRGEGPIDRRIVMSFDDDAAVLINHVVLTRKRNKTKN